MTEGKCIKKADTGINTEQFWDGVATLYSSNEMTSKMADFELELVLKNLDKLNVKGIASFGVADGNRDPIQLLKYLDNKKKSLPDEVYLNDISSTMLNEANKNMTKEGYSNLISELKYIHNPISQIKYLTSTITDKNLTYFIGVYSADYLNTALKMYQNNKEIIGSKFTICALYLNNDLEMKNSCSLTFDIDKYETCMDAIKSMSNEDNFYAYKIITDKNFISHYFSAKRIKVLLEHVFGNQCEIQTYSNGERYIMNIIRDNRNQQNDYVVTMLNNVLGNINSEKHIISLKRIMEVLK